MSVKRFFKTCNFKCYIEGTGMKVSEIECKSIISDSGIYSLDYSINPYQGCEHGCRYCYATFMKKYTGHSEPWGDFVDAKVNAEEVLERDLRRREKGSILLSSVTDPYQPVEKKYELTRRILRRLIDTDFSVSILTKSDLIIRDLDLLKDFRPERISAGLTINFLGEDDKSIWEPSSSPISERIGALETLSKAGVPSYAHVGPYLEGITDLEAILKEVEDFIFEFQIENINLKDRRRKIMDVVKENYPKLKHEYDRICNDDSQYREGLKGKIRELREVHSVPIQLFVG